MRRPSHLSNALTLFPFSLLDLLPAQLEANLELTAELVAAARSAKGAANQPHRSDNVSHHERMYWSAMSEGTGIIYPQPDPLMPPTVWDHTQCMEVGAEGVAFL